MLLPISVYVDSFRKTENKFLYSGTLRRLSRIRTSFQQCFVAVDASRIDPRDLFDEMTCPGVPRPRKTHEAYRRKAIIRSSDWWFARIRMSSRGSRRRRRRRRQRRSGSCSTCISRKSSGRGRSCGERKKNTKNYSLVKVEGSVRNNTGVMSQTLRGG